jgi:hypothetical protein
MLFIMKKCATKNVSQDGNIEPSVREETLMLIERNMGTFQRTVDLYVLLCTAWRSQHF